MKQKFLQLFILTSMITAASFGQPVIIGQKVTGGGEEEFFEAMCLTKDSGLIAGGASSSDISGDKTENSRGSNDYWVIKLDSNGKIQWDKTVGGNDDDFLLSLQQTTDGGYILGGRSLSSASGDKSENSRGDDDYWIVKLDSNGSFQWDKTIGGSGQDDLTSIQQTVDGGYILGGFSYSSISGEKTENSRGGYDYWIVKLNSTGEIQWDKTIGGNSNDFFFSIEQTQDDGYILGGYSYSNTSGEKTENSRGSSDYWIVKVDNTGKIQWDKTIGGNTGEALYSVKQTRDGGYILGGWSASSISGEKTEYSRGFLDYWVVKLDINGKVQWDKTIGGNDWEELHSVQQTHDDGFILGGFSRSNVSGEKTENCRGMYDYWIVKLNKNGELKWDKTIGGDFQDECFSVWEFTKNRYVVGGFSESSISGDKTKKSKGKSDYWIVKLTYRSPNNIEVANNQYENILVSPKINNNTPGDAPINSYSTKLVDEVKLEQNIPNPFTNTTVIKYTLPQKFVTAQIVITDKMGKVLKQATISGSSKGMLTLDASTLSSGAYQYSLLVDGKLISTKQMILAK